MEQLRQGFDKMAAFAAAAMSVMAASSGHSGVDPFGACPKAPAVEESPAMDEDEFIIPVLLELAEQQDAAACSSTARLLRRAVAKLSAPVVAGDEEFARVYDELMDLERDCELSGASATADLICRTRGLLSQPSPSAPPYQQRTGEWALKCFTPEIVADKVLRAYRFLEEALELSQSIGATKEDALKLVDYVYDRPIGEPSQEVGGVMVTLATLCVATGLDLNASAEAELARVNRPEIIEKIRRKQDLKPKNSPLPEHVPAKAAPSAPVRIEADYQGTWPPMPNVPSLGYSVEVVVGKQSPSGNWTFSTDVWHPEDRRWASGKDWTHWELMWGGATDMVDNAGL